VDKIKLFSSRRKNPLKSHKTTESVEKTEENGKWRKTLPWVQKAWYYKAKN